MADKQDLSFSKGQIKSGCGGVRLPSQPLGGRGSPIEFDASLVYIKFQDSQEGVP